jgi:hypothetical protein
MLYLVVGAVMVLWATTLAPRNLQRAQNRADAAGRSTERLRALREGRGMIRVTLIAMTVLGVILGVCGIVELAS